MTEKMRAAGELALSLMTKWGLAGWAFRFNRGKKLMGRCVYASPGRIELSAYMVEMNEEAVVSDTILHEIAHALAGPGTHHGPIWKQFCLKVGADPKRTGHASMPSGRWRATCSECRTVYSKHRRPARGRTYYCRPCGTAARPLNYAQNIPESSGKS